MVRYGCLLAAMAGRNRNRYYSFRNAGKVQLISDNHVTKQNKHNCKTRNETFRGTLYTPKEQVTLKLLSSACKFTSVRSDHWCSLQTMTYQVDQQKLQSEMTSLSYEKY